MYNVLIGYWTIKNVFIYHINYNTITNYILIIYNQSNWDLMLGVVSQIRASVGDRTQDLHANWLALYPLDYQGIQIIKNVFEVFL